jgi:hypothetical protein
VAGNPIGEWSDMESKTEKENYLDYFMGLVYIATWIAAVYLYSGGGR